MNVESQPMVMSCQTLHIGRRQRGLSRTRKHFEYIKDRAITAFAMLKRIAPRTCTKCYAGLSYWLWACCYFTACPVMPMPARGHVTPAASCISQGICSCVKNRSCSILDMLSVVADDQDPLGDVRIRGRVHRLALHAGRTCMPSLPLFACIEAAAF